MSTPTAVRGLACPTSWPNCLEFEAPACFLFSLGPDQTGRAITRIFRPGFFKKVSRTSVVQLYGVRTLLNGTLLPAPHIGRCNAATMRAVRDAGFAVGIHCHNHYRWQDYVNQMSLAVVREEFTAARAEFLRVFSTEARTAGAPGWQSNARSRAVYDEAGLLYASDTRNGRPFFPRIDGRVFSTLEIPVRCPHSTKLIGRPEYPDNRIVPHYLSLLREDCVNVFTLHAEIEGMGRRELFRQLLRAWRNAASSSSASTPMPTNCSPTAPPFQCATRCTPRSTAARASSPSATPVLGFEFWVLGWGNRDSSFAMGSIPRSWLRRGWAVAASVSEWRRFTAQP